MKLLNRIAAGYINVLQVLLRHAYSHEEPFVPASESRKEALYEGFWYRKERDEFENRRNDFFYLSTFLW